VEGRRSFEVVILRVEWEDLSKWLFCGETRENVGSAGLQSECVYFYIRSLAAPTSRYGC
jgi:hypothetical protein